MKFTPGKQIFFTYELGKFNIVCAILLLLRLYLFLSDVFLHLRHRADQIFKN